MARAGGSRIESARGPVGDFGEESGKSLEECFLSVNPPFIRRVGYPGGAGVRVDSEHRQRGDVALRCVLRSLA